MPAIGTISEKSNVQIGKKFKRAKNGTKRAKNEF